MNIDAFCTLCQKDLPHSAALDPSNDLVLTCPVCRHFIKTPKLAPAQLQAHLQEHKKENAGRVFLNPAAVAAAGKEQEAYLQSLVAAGVAKDTQTITPADVGPVPPGVV